MDETYEEITDIVHITWATTNIKRTITFYKQLFAWTFEVQNGTAFLVEKENTDFFV